MRALITVAALALTGCVNLAGFDGGASFGCKAPDGVTCTSLSGVYANVVAGNMPGAPKKAETLNPAEGRGHTITGLAPTSGEPIRSPQKVLRVWVAPWEDGDGDLHDQSYIYVVANDPQWRVEHNRRRIVDRFRPTVAQGSATPGQTKATTPAPTTQFTRPTQAGSPMLPGTQIVPPMRLPSPEGE